ncbi:Pumilio y domain family member 4 [Echria macrotheca]|uniref:Pumilio y domain family member 4 n=1 Tax=Echria macrotheca TaxID=438768 RepID=A0AAJ0BQZ3_9PEZI|nr:Pumilio y domain family member 4 [Echria macrotheca]
MDDFFRSQQSPRGDLPMGAFVSPPRNGPQLPRRFTTDSGRVPTLSSITAAQRGPEPQGFTDPVNIQKVQLLEKKRLDYERIRESRRRFEAEIHKLDAQLEELTTTTTTTTTAARFSGHQSEPTTPPEYRETSAGFPTMFSRPNRYSTSSLTSPPGIFNRPARSGSQLASPQSGIMLSRFSFDDQLPSRSVPGSRRNSDEDEKEEAVRQDPTSHRSTNALNRYSMPVTRSRTYLDIGLEDSNNTTGFLFGDEDSNSGETRTTPTNNPDSFPALLRQQGYSTLLSNSSSSALDLAQSQASTAESTPTNGWNSVSKHRSQQSMSTIGSAINGASSGSEVSAIGSRPSSIRHSIDGIKFFQETSSSASDVTAPTMMSPQTSHIMTPPKLQQSYSTSDIPTVKNTGVAQNLVASTNNHAQQHLQNHNASLGRIPAGALPNRHSRELSSDANVSNGRENGGYPSIGSTLHANATPFGPPAMQAQTTAPALAALTASAPPMPYPYFNGAGYPAHNGAPAGYPHMPMLVQSMQSMTLGNGNPQGVYPPQYAAFNGLYTPTPPRQQPDSQARVIQSRRQMENEAMARFNNLPLENCRGGIYNLCKDQHGCRYLQKQLENRIPEQIHMIWLETHPHVVELMTDPFGNYLCQKLLEYCSDEERTVLIQNSSEAMVRIALNQHGTRALQKMIENVNTPVQIKLIIDALRHKVVDLIQDLNGNHVIQKCLNKLSALDAQFIFEAVGNHCVEVGTHRHGCCVLQRCIDHADGPQKIWLVECITKNAVTLVQDPFGNYVVQYIIDLNQEVFTEPVVRQFKGRICALSKHKFSSNVIEKCLRCALPPTKDMIVDELLAPGEMASLLRDNFANYVIQTALEYATPVMKIRLVETIRPVLPSIRTTPYGRRIQAKVQAYDSRNPRGDGAPGIPGVSDTAGSQVSVRPSNSRALAGGQQMLNGNQQMITASNDYPSTVTPTILGTFATANTITLPPASSTAVPPQPSFVSTLPPPRAFPQYQAIGGPGENGETQWL